jgi:phosphate transport system substrate-binding protein
VNRTVPLILCALIALGPSGCKSIDPRKSVHPAVNKPSEDGQNGQSVDRSSAAKTVSPSTAATNSLVIAAKSEKIEKPDPAIFKGEPLAVVVNRKNPIQSVTLEELRQLCRGENKTWLSGGNVTIAMRERSLPEGQAVLRQILQISESAFARLAQNSATDDGKVVPKELATSKIVCRFVFNVPGAIGFVRASEVDNSVKAIRIDGLDPSDPAYRLRMSAK